MTQSRRNRRLGRASYVTTVAGFIRHALCAASRWAARPVKGVGECGVIPAAAAIISAIEHALDAFGIRIVETPISPARIVHLVNSASLPRFCKPDAGRREASGWLGM